jgi:hypothetical protein
MRVWVYQQGQVKLLDHTPDRLPPHNGVCSDVGNPPLIGFALDSTKLKEATVSLTVYDYMRLGCVKGELTKHDGGWETRSVKRTISFEIECAH